MKLYIADPPYIGQAKKKYGKDPRCAEVDHADLLRAIHEAGDGWALCAGADLNSMRTIVPLLPDDVRICSWVKPFAAFKPGVTLAYAWEPVFIKPARKRPKEAPTCRDWVAANITMKRGLAGAKPERFCFWLFDALGAEPGDELVDLYPGTGAITKAWHRWCDNPLLRLVGA